MNKVVSENVLRWNGHVRKMNKNNLVKEIYESECRSRMRVRRPRRKWMNSVFYFMIERGFTER